MVGSRWYGKKKDTIHNSHFHCSVDHQLEPADDVAHEADIVPVSQKHISHDEVEPLFKTTNVLDTEVRVVSSHTIISIW